MRLLGIDYGTVRIGVALSDEGGSIAFPHAVYPNDKKVIEKIVSLQKEMGIDGVVIGESRNFQGEENPVMKKIHSFKKTLEEKLGVPAYLEPEYLTTAEAKHAEKKGMRDASAAAIILQSYLDKKKMFNT